MGEISRNFHGNLVVVTEITCWKSPLGRPEIYTKANGARVAPYCMNQALSVGETLGEKRFHLASFTSGHVDSCGTPELRAAPLGARRKLAS